ncbi:LOW QUALITY PROTEIN: RxLR effector protein [Phytophthora megakarya]|uniref:RxLR effector protein n=1 Tax=Phytophthora megakarya TaxID=4795 RepID=A0A225WLX6_9STRA|nr:LOW QUALITY PROTEIN: RxLR effector protein [Phytophthora megakarya]
MTTALIVVKRIWFRLLLVVVLHQSCISALLVDFNLDASDSSKVETPTSVGDVAPKGYLRARKLRMTTESDSSDERGFNVGIPSIQIFNDIASAKVKMSSKNQRATDELFTKLKVNRVKTDLFKSPRFKNWFNSVNRAYSNSMEGNVAMVTTLTAHYGDEAVAKVLLEAKRIAKTKSFAWKLEKAQFTKWKRDQKSVENVYKLLKLDEMGDKLFKSSGANTWIQYASNFQVKGDEAMFLTLKTHICEDVDAAKEDNDIATSLEKVELEHWLNTGKSSDEVFKLLRLNDETGNLLKNPAFNTWVSYVTKINKQNPYDIAFAKLLVRYGGPTLAKLIVGAKQDPTMNIIAGGLEVALHKHWIDEGKSANEIFKLLNLEQEGGAVVTSPMWGTWSSYLRNLNKNNPDEAVFLTLKKQFGQEKVMTMVDTTNEFGVKTHVAGKLQEEVWSSEGKTVDNIFKMFKLDVNGDNFVKSPLLSTWMSYPMTLENHNDDLNAISYLEKRFGNLKLARILDDSLQQNNSATTQANESNSNSECKGVLLVTVTAFFAIDNALSTVVDAGTRNLRSVGIAVARNEKRAGLNFSWLDDLVYPLPEQFQRMRTYPAHLENTFKNWRDG